MDPRLGPLNANTAEGSLIAAILSWTGCPRGDAAAAAILARRETAELDEGRLSAILASFGTAGTSCTDDSRP
jgi:type II secretory pathway component PulK